MMALLARAAARLGIRVVLQIPLVVALFMLAHHFVTHHKRAKLEVNKNGQYNREEVRKVIANGYCPGSRKTDLVSMEHCNCHRWIELSGAKTGVSTDGLLYNLSNTTCSADAFARGAGQRVVGFSFYGDMNSEKFKLKGYYEGIVGNLKMMKEFYPGWTMRLYFDLDEQSTVKKDICDLACTNPLLDLCHAGKLPGTPLVNARKVFPMNWRFFPTIDPQVDVFVSRDLDSRFSWREASAVADWLLSDQPIHSMRDHIAHFAPLVGATWGSHQLRKDARLQWRQSWSKILNSTIGWADRNNSGPDQEALQLYVWPWGRNNSVQHDAYLCEQFPGSVPFPTRRLREPNNYVAAVVVQNTTYWNSCSHACRPHMHQDWEQC